MNAIKRAASITALALILCGCSEAERTQSLAACSIEAERTYPTPDDVSSFDQNISRSIRRGYYVKTCMEAHGYEYTSSCFKQDFNSVRIAICLPSAEKNDPGPPFKSPLQVCTQDEQGMTAVRETSAWCYKPTAFLAKVTWQLIGPAEPDMWCYQAREDFQAAVRLPGYL